jgi:hypothetical protein
MECLGRARELRETDGRIELIFSGSIQYSGSTSNGTWGLAAQTHTTRVILPPSAFFYFQEKEGKVITRKVSEHLADVNRILGESTVLLSVSSPKVDFGQGVHEIVADSGVISLLKDTMGGTK